MRARTRRVTSGVYAISTDEGDYLAMRLDGGASGMWVVRDARGRIVSSHFTLADAKRSIFAR